MKPFHMNLGRQCCFLAVITFDIHGVYQNRCVTVRWMHANLRATFIFTHFKLNLFGAEIKTHRHILHNYVYLWTKTTTRANNITWGDMNIGVVLKGRYQIYNFFLKNHLPTTMYNGNISRPKQTNWKSCNHTTHLRMSGLFIRILSDF